MTESELVRRNEIALRPLQCRTVRSVCPDLVDFEIYGHHKSVVLDNNCRLWTFESVGNKRKFLMAVNQGEFRRVVETESSIEVTDGT